MYIYMSACFRYSVDLHPAGSRDVHAVGALDLHGGHILPVIYICLPVLGIALIYILLGAGMYIYMSACFRYRVDLHPAGSRHVHIYVCLF